MVVEIVDIVHGKSYTRGKERVHSTTKTDLATGKVTEISTNGIVHGNSTPGPNDVKNINVVTPVGHTIQVGNGPAIPVIQAPQQITPEPGYMNLTRSVPKAKK